MLLRGFLGQPPFTDEEARSTIIRQVYLDGKRADDDDSVLEDSEGAVPVFDRVSYRALKQFENPVTPNHPEKKTERVCMRQN